MEQAFANLSPEDIAALMSGVGGGALGQVRPS
jgi:hypothetical protein